MAELVIQLQDAIVLVIKTQLDIVVDAVHLCLEHTQTVLHVAQLIDLFLEIGLLDFEGVQHRPWIGIRNRVNSNSDWRVEMRAVHHEGREGHASEARKKVELHHVFVHLSLRRLIALGAFIRKTHRSAAVFCFSLARLSLLKIEFAHFSLEMAQLSVEVLIIDILIEVLRHIFVVEDLLDIRTEFYALNLEIFLRGVFEDSLYNLHELELALHLAQLVLHFVFLRRNFRLVGKLSLHDIRRTPLAVCLSRRDISRRRLRNSENGR